VINISSYRSWERRKTIIWVVLAIFVMLSAGLVGIVRGSAFGLGRAMVDRYLTLASVFWIAFAAISVKTMSDLYGSINRTKGMATIFCANIVFAVVLSVLFVVVSYRWFGLEQPRVTEQHRICLQAVPVTEDLSCLYGLHPVFDPDGPSFRFRSLALDRIKRMAAYELGVFSDE